MVIEQQISARRERAHGRVVVQVGCVWWGFFRRSFYNPGWRVGVRFGCAALASGTMLLSRRQGGDGTRVFTVSSVLGPTVAQRCQAGPRPTLPLKGHCSEIPGRLPARLPRPQPIEPSGYCEPHDRSPPQEVRRIHPAKGLSSKRKERRQRQNAEPDDQRVPDGHIAYGICVKRARGARRA